LGFGIFKKVIRRREHGLAPQRPDAGFVEHRVIAFHPCGLPLLVHRLGHAAALDAVGVIHVGDRHQKALTILRRNVFEQTAIRGNAFEQISDLRQAFTLHSDQRNKRGTLTALEASIRAHNLPLTSHFRIRTRERRGHG
jgi:hypothetical protein